MNIKCPSCSTVLRIDESKYNQDNIVVQCPSCNQKIRVPLPAKTQLNQKSADVKIVDEYFPRKEATTHKAASVEKEKAQVVDFQFIDLLIGALTLAFIYCGCYAIYDMF